MSLGAKALIMMNFHLICEALDPLHKFTVRSCGSFVRVCASGGTASRLVESLWRCLTNSLLEQTTWFQVPRFGSYRATF